MNGPDHYRNAEYLMATLPDNLPAEDRAGLLAAAQVHATLALAAATVDVAIVDGHADIGDEDAWVEVTTS